MLEVSVRKLVLLLTVVLSCALGLSALAADGPSPTEKPGPKKSGFYDFWNISDQFAGGIGTIGNTSCTVGAASQPSVHGGSGPCLRRQQPHLLREHRRPRGAGRQFHRAQRRGDAFRRRRADLVALRDGGPRPDGPHQGQDPGPE